MSNANYADAVALLIEAIEIPESAYERAQARYEALGRWLCRPESACRGYDPSIFPQGSFLLGTVIRPIGDEEEYDLDLSCKLNRGVSKFTHTQKELKDLVGGELESYRRARQIAERLGEKRRCWRLVYQDEMSFHMDVVPCIPEEAATGQRIMEAMIARGSDRALAAEASNLTVAITDNEREDYAVRCSDWNVSNPQGYGRWFVSRMQLATSVRDRLLMDAREGVEKLPTYKLKSPLQRCVQLLKRHRNVMFKDDPERQPISIIITTLAARAYGGEEDVAEALHSILDTMDSYVNPREPRVPNPVDPDEDFADRWDTDEGRELDLEGNFHRWLRQARADFRALSEARDAEAVVKRAADAFEAPLGRDRVRDLLGLTGAPAVVIPAQRIEQQPKPWSSG